MKDSQNETRQDVNIQEILGDKLLSASPMEILALQALAEVAKGQQNQGSSRASAARTLLEYMGKLGPGKDDPQAIENKPISGMTIGQIDAELALDD